MSDVYNMQTLLNSLGYSLDVTVSDSSPKKKTEELQMLYQFPSYKCNWGKMSRFDIISYVLPSIFECGARHRVIDGAR